MIYGIKCVKDSSWHRDDEVKTEKGYECWYTNGNIPWSFTDINLVFHQTAIQNNWGNKSWYYYVDEIK